MTKGDQIVLQHGVAARLHIDPLTVDVRYAPSTFAGTPAGIEDESASIRIAIRPHPENIGFVARKSWYSKFTLPELADRIADNLKSHIA